LRVLLVFFCGVRNALVLDQFLSKNVPILVKKTAITQKSYKKICPIKRPFFVDIIIIFVNVLPTGKMAEISRFSFEATKLPT